MLQTLAIQESTMGVGTSDSMLSTGFIAVRSCCTKAFPSHLSVAQGLTTTFDDHMLIIGDAAGHIDPLTGEW